MMQALKVPAGLASAKPLPVRPPLQARRLHSVSLGVRCQAGGETSFSPPTQDTVPAEAMAAPVVADSTATMYVPMQDPRLYQQQQHQQQQQYYMAAPPVYYPPPPPPAYKQEEAVGSGVPWFIWVAIGFAANVVLTKVQEYMKNPKTPQQMMAELAMKQMMGSMGNQAGGSPFGPPGGASPFGGAPPFGGAGASPFAGFNGMPPQSAATSTVETTATSVPAQSQFVPPPPPTSERFAERLATEGRSTTSSSQSSSSSKPLDLVDPVVKEPSNGNGSNSSSSSSGAGSNKARSSIFADVTDVTGSAASSSNKGGASSNGAGGGAGSAPGAQAGSTEEAAVMSNMMEQMLKNPELQKMLYPYLPEPMRNPQSIEWMMGNPEVKKQMEAMFAQQNTMSPQMMDMMKGMNFNQDKVNKQFEELGLKPEDVISKVMANPELAAGFQSPKVQAAIIDISASPMNIVKYQNDPEVMKVLNEVTQIFSPQVPPSAR